jgi:hypothetical protein
MPIRDPIKRKEYHKQYGAKWYRDNIEKSKAQSFHRNLKRHYKITSDQMQDMFVNQMGRCAICKTEFSETNMMCVDHCHTTGKVRSLLCRSCNTGIGMFKENSKAMMNAILYLTEWAVKK